jgi:hypothetical protein
MVKKLCQISFKCLLVGLVDFINIFFHNQLY